MFSRLRSLVSRRLVVRTVLAAGAVAGLCALADQGARRLNAGGPERGGERLAAAPKPADPVTTGSIRPPAPPTAPVQAAAYGDALDRRGLAALMSSGAANAVAAPAPKRKPEPAAARQR